MGFLRTKKQKPDYTGLQIQTSTSTLPVPLVWGRQRLAPNVVWYANFETHKTKTSGKGGLFSSSSSGYDYTAAVIMALCEGPIGAIGQVWKDQSVYSLSGLDLTLFDGSTPQSVWSYLTTAFPSQALAYQGTAFVCSPDYDLGSSATISNHNFEIIAALAGSGVNGVDADPAQVIGDFLTNAQYGAGFPSASISAATLYGVGGDASLQTYCAAVGLCFSPCLVDQETAQSILTRWLQLLNCAAVWTGGELKFLPYGDSATSSGTVLKALQTRQVNPPPVPNSGPPDPPSITVCAPANFISDLGVTYAQSGTALTSIGASVPSAAGTYGMTTAGQYLFAIGDENTLVKIAYEYAVAASYVPDVTPLYALTDDDLVYAQGEDPILVTRSDPYQQYNVWRLEMSARDNAYAMIPVESRDQDAVERYGLRVSSAVTAHEICDETVAAIAGQLMLQRALYIRNTFKLKLSWEFCLLDPMDIIEINDANLGFTNTAIRIVAIEEADDGTLTLTAEELPLGVASAPLYPTQGGIPPLLNRDVTVESVNTPIIFEPPAALAGNPAVWIAASGGSGGIADPNWGGCNVWLSLDNTTFSQIGTITTPARMGTTSASLAAFTAANPDNSNTLSVDLTESAGTLQTATTLDAQLANTLCLVGSELVSYATATLTATSKYDLTGLYRGLYGTAAASHSSGAPFARLDSAIFEYPLPASYVGKTLYIKLQSFNIFGGGLEDISSCTAYTYVPTGTAIDHPVAQLMQAGTPINFGAVTDAVGMSDDFGAPALVTEFDEDLGLA